MKMTLAATLLLGLALALPARAQPPGRPPGPGGPPGPGPNPDRMLQRAFTFDRDGDGQLSREEFRAFAEDFARRATGRPGAGGPPPEADHDHDHDAPAPRVTITVRDGYRFIEANGIPDHETGRFPNRGNPNRIAPQMYRFRVPVEPRRADEPIPARILGVALNGVPFDPGTAELWNGDPNWRYDALSGQIDLGIDASNAHVQPNGAYHYHALPLGLIGKLGKPADGIVLVGWAADGYPIYNDRGYRDPKDPQSELVTLASSYRLKKGERPGGVAGPGGAYDGTFNQDWEYVPGAGDLDECNGRFAVTPEFPGGTYHYVITKQFPFIGRLYRGEPDPSFRRGGPPPGGPRPGR